MAGDSPCSDSLNYLLEHAAWRSNFGNELDLMLVRAKQKRTREVDLIIAPVIYCCCRGVSKLFFIAVGLIYLVYCLNSINILFVQGLYPRAYSAKVSSLRSAYGTPFSVAFLEFHTDCNSTASISEPRAILGFTIKFNSSRRCSGEKYFFTIQSEDGNKKHLIGSSSMRWTATELRFIDSGVDDCSDTVLMNYKPSWPWYFGPESPVFLTLASVSFLVAGVCTILNNYSVLKVSIIILLITLTTISAISFAGFLSIHSQKEAFYPCSLSMGFAFSVLALLTSERSVIDRSPFISLWFLLCRVVNDVALFEDAAYLQSRPPIIQCAFFLVGVFVSCRSRSFVRSTAVAVQGDRPAFDAAWAELKCSAGNAPDLARLAALSDAMARSCSADSHGPLQRNRERSAGAHNHSPDGRAPRRHPSALESWLGSWFGQPEARHSPGTLTGTAGAAVCSLDQLYSQAILAAPALISQCGKWADASSGRLEHDHSLTRNELAEGEAYAGGLPPALRRLVRMRAVKCPWAAAVKAVSCYRGDVARLLDVCRCRIVFDSVADLARCLAAVAASPEVRVVRVRNWLRDEHDPWASAGFRAVVVLLRLDSDEARRSGIENMVCELQLVPGPMAVALRSTSHRYYRDFRALRQEGVSGNSPTSASAQPIAVGPVARAWSLSVRINSESPVQGGDDAVTDTTCRLESPKPSQLHKEAVIAVTTAEAKESAQGEVHTVESEEMPEAAATAELAVYDEPELCPILLQEPAIPTHGNGRNEETREVQRHGKFQPVRKMTSHGIEAVTRGNSDSWAGQPPNPSLRRSNAELWAALMEAAHVVHERYVVGEHRALDREASKFEQALNASSSASVLFSSTPFAAYAAKPMGKVRISVLAIIWITFVVSLCVRILADGAGHLDYPLVRFRPLALFDPALLVHAAGKAGITRFGMLENDCRIPSTWSASINGSGDELFMTVTGHPRANGYFFTLPAGGPPDLDPIRWVVEASDYSGTIWKPVAPCLWATARTSFDGGRSWWPLSGSAGRLVDCTDGTLGLALEGYQGIQRPLARGSEVRIDFRAEDASLWLTFGFLLAPVGWSCAAACALSGHPQRVKPILVTTMASWSIWSLSCEIANGAQGSGWQRGLYLWISFLNLPALWSATAFQVLERHLVLLFFIDGLLFWAGLAVLGAVIYGRGMPAALQRDESCWLMIAVGLYLSLGSLVFFFLRRRALSSARKLVEADCERYQRAWTSVLESQNDACLLLAKASASLENRVILGVLRQTRRRSIAAGSGSVVSASQPNQARSSNILILLWQRCSRRIIPIDFVGPSFVPGTSHDPMLRYPLRSLDQLYIQAGFVQPILVYKAKQWAAGCGGCFPLASTLGRASFVRYESGERAEDTSNVRFCDLKSPGRAIEKLVRSYGQDTSRLLDVCRQAIIFDDMDSMSSCLDSIGSDPEVRIVRMKNRYLPGYDPGQSGGYRDVLLNLQLWTPESLLFGVEAHICELQLILRQFAALKTEDGHRHYVAVRNLKAD